jgi:hypothetical protein
VSFLDLTAAPGSMGYMGWLGRLRESLGWLVRLGARILDAVATLAGRIINAVRRLVGWVANWLRKLPGRTLDRYRDWNRGRYLSNFERRLNRLLWLLFWIALVYAVFQHVLLANVPERFPGGARIGIVCYDLSIAYCGAFLFYLLNIRVPLRRDRRNIYRHIGPQVGLIIGDAIELMRWLNLAAGIEPTSRANTWANIQETCRRATPNSPVPQTVAGVSATGTVPYTAAGTIVFRINRTRYGIKEVLSFSSYLASDLIDLLVAIETYSHFQSFGQMAQVVQQLGGGIGNENLSAWARQIFDYLQLVDDLDRYAQAHLNMAYEKRPGLIAGTELDSSAVPLRRRTSG